MKPVLRCAIDSYPLSHSLEESYDYSGLQLHGLSQTPLCHYLADACHHSDGTEWYIPIQADVRWSDGVKLTAKHFLSGVSKFVANPFVKKILFRKVRQIIVQDEHLVVHLNQANFRLKDALAIPNFCPQRPGSGAVSGPFVPTSQNDAEYHFTANPYQANHDLVVKVIKEPEINVRSFRSRHIDITADTAFPLSQINQWRSQLITKDTGLRGMMQFSAKWLGEEAVDFRRRLKNLCQQIEFSAITHNCWIPSVREEIRGKPTAVLGQTLRLAYDDFYPNKAIAERIANTLGQAGINCVLIQDDYYQPHAAYDLKFVIQRPLAPNAYLSYASWLLADGLRPARPRYFQLLDAWEGSVGQDEFFSDSLNQILDDLVPFVDLFRIPSMALAVDPDAPNPLLRNLIEA